jgi:hypothetical protein
MNKPDTVQSYTKYDDGPALQGGGEGPLGAGVEAVDIHVRDLRHPPHHCRLDMVKAPRSDSPDGQLAEAGYLDIHIGRVLGLQHDAGGRDPQPLHRQLPVKDRDNHASVARLQCAVHDEFVAIADAGALH